MRYDGSQNDVLEKYYQAIDEIMDNFDFEKVKKVMDFLNWKWRGKTPEIYDIKKFARDMLNKLINDVITSRLLGKKVDTYSHSSGGFEAKFYYDYLYLNFIIENWEYEIQESSEETTRLN